MSDNMPRILIVDDDESTRTTLALVFGEKGYQTETAGTGQEALDKVRERFFNLALLDIKLPDMSGLDLLARLREAHPDMATVMATAYASLETAVRALHEGASAYVTKPLRMDEVLVTVRQALEKQRLTLENRQLLETLQRELIEREQAEAQARRLATQLKSIARPARQMSALLDLDELAQQVVRSVQEVTGCYNANLFLLEGDELVLAAGHGGYEDGRPPLGARLPLGQGIIGHAAQAGQPLLVPDVSLEPRYLHWESLPQTRTELAVPVLRGERVLGVVDMQHVEPDAFDAADLEALGVLADQLAVALENTRLYEAERRRREMLDTLYHLSKQLVATDELGYVLSIVARYAGEAVNVTFCRVVMLEQDTLICRAAHPTRVLDRDLGVGQPEPPPAWSHYRRVLGAREPVLLSQDDPALSAAECHALLLDLAQTLCVCPLRAGDEEIGVLVMGEERGPDREPFGADKLRLAGAIADIAASALHRAALHRQTRQRLERLDALRTIDMAITASLDLEVILNVLLDQVTERLNVDAADVLLFDPDTLSLEFVAGHGIDAPASGRTELRPEECLAGRAVLERHAIADLRLQISDLESEWPEMSNLQPVLSPVEVSQISNLKSHGFVSYYAAPLIAKGEVKGVLEILHREPLDPDPEWLRFVESVAAQAAIAIDELELFRGLQRSNADLMRAYDSTLEGWARALELRDAETEGHSRRVTDMALDLASAMGLSEEELVHVRRGALLHDIGKMGIPDSILTKPGKLDDDEWDIIHLHPVHAFEMLAPIPFLGPALDIPYCHHERWDGTGYPRRLKGQQIPLPARIFAVVDVYDALTTDRPYRQAWPKEKALVHIRDQAGQHFDPEVVEAFLGLLEGQ